MLPAARPHPSQEAYAHAAVKGVASHGTHGTSSIINAIFNHFLPSTVTVWKWRRSPLRQGRTETSTGSIIAACGSAI